jgi:hypothetical protein
MKSLDQLHAANSEAREMFDHSDNLEVRNILAQTLTVTSVLICCVESGEAVPEDEIKEAVQHARTYIEAAINYVEPCAATEKSPIL